MLTIKSKKMRSLNYGPLTAGQAVKIWGRGCNAKISYTGASSLVLALAAGHSANGDDHTEITNESGTLITRFTANGSGAQNIQVNGLEPGVYVSMIVVSGTGTASAMIITGTEA